MIKYSLKLLPISIFFSLSLAFFSTVHAGSTLDSAARKIAEDIAAERARAKENSSGTLPPQSEKKTKALVERPTTGVPHQENSTSPSVLPSEPELPTLPEEELATKPSYTPPASLPDQPASSPDKAPEKLVLPPHPTAIPDTDAELASYTPDRSYANPNWYLSIMGGTSFADDADVKSANTRELSYATGGGFGSALGYRPSARRGFASHFRSDIEAFYRQNDIDADGILPLADAAGDLRVFSLMANAYYDLTTHTEITPYVGMGIGYANFQLDNARRINIEDDSDFSTAYQFMAGLSYSVDPNATTAFHAGYRYFDVLSDPSFRTTTGTAVSIDHSSHNVEGGVRMYF